MGKQNNEKYQQTCHLSHEDVEGRRSEVGRLASEVGSGDDAESLLAGLEVDVVGDEVDAVHLIDENINIVSRFSISNLGGR